MLPKGSVKLINVLLLIKCKAMLTDHEQKNKKNGFNGPTAI
jgi:hypothetical protein